MSQYLYELFVHNDPKLFNLHRIRVGVTGADSSLDYYAIINEFNVCGVNHEEAVVDTIEELKHYLETYRHLNHELTRNNYKTMGSLLNLVFYFHTPGEEYYSITNTNLSIHTEFYQTFLDILETWVSTKRNRD